MDISQTAPATPGGLARVSAAPAESPLPRFPSQLPWQPHACVGTQHAQHAKHDFRAQLNVPFVFMALVSYVRLAQNPAAHMACSLYEEHHMYAQQNANTVRPSCQLQDSLATYQVSALHSGDMTWAARPVSPGTNSMSQPA